MNERTGSSAPQAGAAAGPAQPAPTHPALVLIDLVRRARLAGSPAELRFLLVNDSHRLAPYRQAALWLRHAGVQALSGVVQVEANAPYAQWLHRVMTFLADTQRDVAALTAQDLPPELAAEWSHWLPAQACWLPLAPGRDEVTQPGGGLLVARDLPWQPNELALLTEWLGQWRLAWLVQAPASPWRWRRLFARKVDADKAQEAGPWWKRRAVKWAAAALVVAVLPVRLSILAPGELVPAHPSVIRAPIDGVVGVFHVQPNQKVSKDQALFGFDEAVIKAKLDVALQTLAVADAEYRQSQQMALSDARAKSQLLVLQGRIEEKRAEAVMLQEQLERSQVRSPRDGVVLFDDPTEWLGRPLSVGEAVMRVASLDDMEVEAWVPMADAIPLAEEASVTLYLNASPLSPVDARLRYFAHEAVKRPDGSYAYRLRARLAEDTSHRVGLKGTVRVHGRWVPLVYWVMRRPWAGIRTFVGW